MDDTYSRLLRDYWGYRTFRPHQREIIANAAQGHDVLAILPTGGGKSLTFQIAGLARKRWRKFFVPQGSMRSIIMQGFQHKNVSKGKNVGGKAMSPSWLPRMRLAWGLISQIRGTCCIWAYPPR